MACLRGPTLFLDALPPDYLPSLRVQVAHYQYNMLLGVHSLRAKLPMPTRTDPQTHESQFVSAWYGNVRHRQIKPNPTQKVVGAGAVKTTQTQAKNQV